MANIIRDLLSKKKKTPQLGGSNPKNIDVMVAAGELTEEEGRKIKERIKKKNEEARKKKLKQ